MTTLFSTIFPQIVSQTQSVVMVLAVQFKLSKPIRKLESVILVILVFVHLKRENTV